MSELLDRIHKEIRERMAASRAAALEYERLEAALKALTDASSHATRRGTSLASAGGSGGRAATKAASGGTGGSGRAAASTGTRAAARRGGGRGRSSATASGRATRRAPRGANREAVLRVVADRPGVSSGELADATAIKRATLSTLLTTLTKRGELERREMPGARRGYALAASTDAGNNAKVVAEAPESAPDANGQAPPDQRGDLTDPPAEAAEEPRADESSANQRAAGGTS